MLIIINKMKCNEVKIFIYLKKKQQQQQEETDKK